MNDRELTLQQEHIGNCVSCSLAEAMKDCNNCSFRIGLAVRKIYWEIKRLEAEYPDDTDDPSVIERFTDQIPQRIWDAYCDYQKKCWMAERRLEHSRKRIFTLEEERLAEAVAGCVT